VGTSIRGKQIRDETIESVDLASGSIKAGEMNAEAISSQTEITTVHNTNDRLLIWDATDSSLKKVAPKYAAKPAGATGYVQFNYDDEVFGSSANFIYDGTNDRLGLGASSPKAPLHVNGGDDASMGTAASGYLIIGNTAAQNIVMDNNEIMARTNGGAYALGVQSEGGIVRIGTSSVDLTGAVLEIANTDQSQELLRVTSNDTGTARGPFLALKRTNSSPADNDFLGAVSFWGVNTDGTEGRYAMISSKVLDVTPGTEDGSLEISVAKNGTAETVANWQHDGLRIPDSKYYMCGDADDLQIYHNGGNSFIDDTGAGELRLRTNSGCSIREHGGSDILAKFNLNSSVDLYHNGSETFKTINGGCAITGSLAIQERSSDPDNPAEGSCIIWMSDGTESGSDGDIMVKITVGDTTKTITMVDFSAG